MAWAGMATHDDRSRLMRPSDYHERASVYTALQRLRTAGDYYARRAVLDDIRREQGNRFADKVDRLWQARARA